jgi:hypothetical protein
MAWCPGCSYEYKAGTKKKCPDCGAALPKGPGLSRGLKFGNRTWYSIRSAGDSVQAELLKSFLESNGYDVALKNGNGAVSSKDELDPMKSGIQILIPADSASSAAKLVRASNDWLTGGSFAGDDDEMEDYDLDGDDREFLQSNGIAVEYDDEYYCY